MDNAPRFCLHVTTHIITDERIIRCSTVIVAIDQNVQTVCLGQAPSLTCLRTANGDDTPSAVKVKCVRQGIIARAMAPGAYMQHAICPAACVLDQTR